MTVVLFCIESYLMSVRQGCCRPSDNVSRTTCGYTSRRLRITALVGKLAGATDIRGAPGAEEKWGCADVIT